MANDHFYCVFLNNEKISEQISWRIDTCPRRLDQQTQSFMDQFTYFRLFLDFCHLSCTSWNFIRPLPPTLFILFPRFHYLCCLLKLFWFQQRSIWAVFSTCTLTLNLLFFPGIIPLERLFLKISKTHTLTHQGLEAHRRQKQLPVSLQTSPPPLSPKPPFCSIPPSLPSSSLGPLAVTVFPLSLAPLYDPPSFGRNCSRYFFSLSLVNVYPAWRFL